MLTRKKMQISILLVIGIVLLVNIISSRLFFRLDFTGDKIYSLSKATKNLLENLNEPVTITAYFSEDLPPDIAKVRQDFRDLLVEYNSSSDGQIVYEFINPNKDEETEIKAQQEGIRPIMINVRERDQVKQQRAYLGAVLQLEDRKEVIPFIQPGAAMEYALSSNIKKISVKNKPRIALLSGNGEPSLQALPQLLSVLSVMYEVETLTLEPVSEISNDFQALVVIAPKDTIPEFVFSKLDNYLSAGGNVCLALNTVEGDLMTAAGNVIHTGFNQWLKTKGIEVEEKFLVDVNCSSVMVRQQQGMFVMNTPVSFPYLPVISDFAEHPVTKGLESVIFPFASPFKFNVVDTSIAITPIAFSSEKSGVQSPPLYFDISRQWTPGDFNLSSLPVALALEGNISGVNSSRMVIFGDGDFAVNGEGQQVQQLQPDNISLLANAVDWLSDDTGLIELRTKGVTSRPLNAQLEDGTKTAVKYINFLIPILLIIIYGAVRFQLNRSKRNKLKTVDYVR